jgi:SNF2 family DNA or RNA helicase
MYVIHAHWRPASTPTQSGALCIWCETSEAQAPNRKIDKRHRDLQPHPFVVEITRVRAVLVRLTGLDLTGGDDNLSLRLPTGRTAPQPSPQLVHEWPLDESTLSLAPWQIPALALNPADALTLLMKLPTEELPHDMRLADDLHFWRTAARLALEALAQHRLQPGLVSDAAGKLVASWLPVLDGPRDGPRLARLREAMPPLCRAAVVNTEPTPRSLLDSFLAALVDGAMRRWCRTMPSLFAVEDATARDWLGALLRKDAQIQASVAQAQRLHASYRAWLRNLHVAGDSNFRVTLRLDAPEQADANQEPVEWSLRYLLQARDDPSLMVDASEIWQKRSELLSGLQQRLHNPQELLLGGLGFVARHSDPVRRSLQDKRPVVARLSSDEAFTYMRQVAPLLESSGFGVLVPPWWNQPGGRLGLRLRMKGKGSSSGNSDGVGSGLLNMNTLASYRWELSVGGEALSREEFETLVALKSSLVKVRGKWVQLDAEQIEAAIRFWQRQDDETEIGLLDAAALTLDGAQLNGLPVEGVEAEGWLQEWLDRFTGHETLAVLPPPDGLTATLRPYQAYGYSWLDFQRRWGIGVCLADDMGLGKTIQTLSMLQRVKEQAGALPAPVLLVAPTSVVVNWVKEAARFTPELRVLVHQGGQRLRGDEFAEVARQHDFVATSYALVRRDAEVMQTIDWFGVILDEAQNIKNPETKQTQLIRQLPASFRLALTGTPVENRLTELWSIMHFLNPGFLGSRRTFRERFAQPIERDNDEQASARLRRLISPFILRRVKSDPSVIQDLPDKQETKEYCHLSTEQATLYQAVVSQSLQAIEGAEEIQRRGMVLAMLMKLKQICNHPAQFMHQMGEGATTGGGGENPLARSGKLERLVELVEELLNAGDRALIFSQFAEMGGFLRHFLQDHFGVPVLFLHGGTPARKRNEMVERFQQEADGPRIFVLSLKAGGTGLNLTRANHVFHFDRWWNPAVEDQATDRAFRIGQKQNVLVHKFVCVGTLEEKIDAMIEQKKGLARSIVGSGENWLTEMSTDDLRDLVRLQREVMA